MAVFLDFAKAFDSLDRNVGIVCKIGILWN